MVAICIRALHQCRGNEFTLYGQQYHHGFWDPFVANLHNLVLANAIETQMADISRIRHRAHVSHESLMRSSLIQFVSTSGCALSLVRLALAFKLMKAEDMTYMLTGEYHWS